MLTDPPFDPAMIIGDHLVGTEEESRIGIDDVNAKVHWLKMSRMQRVRIAMRNLLIRLTSRRYRRGQAITRIDSNCIPLDVALFTDRFRKDAVKVGNGSKCSTDCRQQVGAKPMRRRVIKDSCDRAYADTTGRRVLKRNGARESD